LVRAAMPPDAPTPKDGTREREEKEEKEEEKKVLFKLEGQFGVNFPLLLRSADRETFQMIMSVLRTTRVASGDRNALSARSKGRTTRRLIVRGEDPKITREYREEDDTVLSNLDQMIGGTAKEQQQDAAQQGGAAGDSQYIDDLPEIPRTEMSDAMKEKLRREYYSLGGSPNKTMGSNYFLNIILVISALAIASAALGYL
jgi:hypothetical protein